MKRDLISLALTAALVLCLFTGCAGSAGNGTEAAANSSTGSGEGIYHAELDVQEDGTEDSTETEEFVSPFAGRQEEVLDLSEAKLDDSDKVYTSSRCVSNGDGYFYVGSQYLMFYDLAAGTSVPVCNRANCMHNDFDCNANVSEYYPWDMCYWGGYIYMPYVGENTVYLARISADGSTREDEYMPLSTFAVEDNGMGGTSSNTEIPSFIIWNGYVYYSFQSESVPKIRRIKLGDSDAEIIYTAEGERPLLYNLCTNGDFLFFEADNFTDESQLHLEGGLMAYNVKIGECSFVKNSDDGLIYDFCVDDGMLYYELETGIYRKSLTEEGEQEFVMDIGTADAKIYVSGNALYAINLSDYSVTAYGLDGEKLAQINVSGGTEGLDGCCWIDGVDIFGYYDEGTAFKGYFLTLSDLLAGKGEWVEI